MDLRLGRIWQEWAAPAVAKVLAGTNPLFSVPNSIKVLTTEEDMYEVEASSALDKGIAIAGIAAPFNPGANASRMFLGSAKSGKIVDGINTLIQTSNDGGLLDKKKYRNRKMEIFQKLKMNSNSQNKRMMLFFILVVKVQQIKLQTRELFFYRKNDIPFGLNICRNAFEY